MTITGLATDCGATGEEETNFEPGAAFTIAPVAQRIQKPDCMPSPCEWQGDVFGS
jgi:hypothetical protein